MSISDFSTAKSETSPQITVSSRITSVLTGDFILSLSFGLANFSITRSAVNAEELESLVGLRVLAIASLYKCLTLWGIPLLLSCWITEAIPSRSRGRDIAMIIACALGVNAAISTLPRQVPQAWGWLAPAAAVAGIAIAAVAHLLLGTRYQNTPGEFEQRLGSFRRHRLLIGAFVVCVLLQTGPWALETLKRQLVTSHPRLTGAHAVIFVLANCRPSEHLI